MKYPESPLYLVLAIIALVISVIAQTYLLITYLIQL
jgi:hypothetical protein